MKKKNPLELYRMWHGGELTIVGDADPPGAGAWAENVLPQIIDYGDRQVRIHQIDLDISCHRLLTPGGTPQLQDMLELDWELSSVGVGGQLHRMLSVGRHKIYSGYSGDPGAVTPDQMSSKPDLYLVRQKLDFGGEDKVLELDYDESLYVICNTKVDSAVAINWFFSFRTIAWLEQIGEWGRR